MLLSFVDELAEEGSEFKVKKTVQSKKAAQVGRREKRNKKRQAKEAKMGR